MYRNSEPDGTLALDRLHIYKYCRMPDGRGLQKTARPPSRDETRSINPLKMKRRANTRPILTKAG